MYFLTLNVKMKQLRKVKGRMAGSLRNVPELDVDHFRKEENKSF